MNSILYISLDIGGTLSKVCIAAESIEISSNIDSKSDENLVKIADKFLKLYFQTFDDIKECLHFLKGYAKQYETIKIGLTGGGTIKHE